jgi:predicted RNA-binding Zn-ribbon protein involved in translation (DUF1610 family)
MIHFGWRVREIDLNEGQFHCPTCRQVQACSRKRYAKYFTLLFIPLVETESLGQACRCHVCGMTFQMEAIEDPNAIWECTECRNGNPNTTYKCKKCGFSLI